ncbi:MAG: DUF421 domain-containing protein [Ruminococcaceae bacterium]|nr:DUF421 domain-containing protein [Oscillospiraceae bacterium]
MFIPFVRTLILYIFVIVAIRMMGKRQVGEMQPTELVITILVSAVASVPMQNLDIPLSYGVVPILTLISAEIFVSFIALKIPRFREILTGKPVIIIVDGVIDQKALKATRLSVEELQEDLRLKDVFDLASVRLARLETNGQLSVLLKDRNQPVTPEIMGQKVKDSPVYYTVIADGYVNRDIFEIIGIDSEWVGSELKKKGITSIKDVFLMLCSTDKKVAIIKKEDK